jgi:hypothetical protein
MKVFQDLILKGTAEKLKECIAAIEERLSDGWTRSCGLEREAGLVDFDPMYCFSCSSRENRPACDLWIASRSSTRLYVSNIVPQDRSSLTYDQYNAVLREFLDRFAQAAADSTGVEVELGNANPQLEDFLSVTTAAALRAFSSHANRSILHSLDHERWNRFLSNAHRDQSSLSSDMLRRWLVDEEKWPEDIANELVIEYDQGRRLLETYESLEAQQV